MSRLQITARGRYSLTRRIQATAALFALLMVFAVGAAAFFFAQGLIREQMQASLTHGADDLAKQIRGNLTALDNALNALARNTLVANALVDSFGRDAYLGAFIADYREIDGLPVRLKVTDFRGRSLLQGMDDPVPGADWARQLAQRGEPQVRIAAGDTDPLLVLGRPVIFANTGLPEGGLVLEVAAEALLRSDPELLGPNWAQLYRLHLRLSGPGRERPLVLTRGEGPQQGVSVQRVLQLPVSLSPLRVELELTLDPATYTAPLRKLIGVYAVMAALALAFVLFASRSLARVLTRDLRRLEEAARELRQGGGLSGRLPEDADEEVAQLGRAFNYVLDRLQGANAELRRSADELRDAVKENRRARAAAEAANRAKSAFLANMSHELRTPLNAILGFGQLLRRDAGLSAQQREHLRIIDSSGEHLLSLINDILTVAKIEAGRLERLDRTFDLPEKLSAVHQILGVDAQRKDLLFDLNLASELPRYVVGDAQKLEQILLNLVGNAIKYTPSGRVALRARPIRCDEQSCKVLFEVEDSGPGIPPDAQEQIFDAFSQTEEAARAGEGTGLGLAICRRFVGMLGGELSVASRSGEGARFFFTLELRLGDASQISTESKRRQVAGLQPGQSDFRILVVEDNPNNRVLLCELLVSAGFSVRGVEDGAQAVAVCTQWRPQFVWMDMRMPVLDGYQATRRIKQRESCRDTVVVALTASAFEEDRQQILDAGCDDFVRKPLRDWEIFETMERYLGVRYRYADRDEPAAESGSERSALIDLARLKQIPRDRLQGLARAVEELDREAALAALKGLEDLDPELVATLRQRVQDFLFEDVQRALEQGRGSAP